MLYHGKYQSQEYRRTRGTKGRRLRDNEREAEAIAYTYNQVADTLATLLGGGGNDASNERHSR